MHYGTRIGDKPPYISHLSWPKDGPHRPDRRSAGNTARDVSKRRFWEARKGGYPGGRGPIREVAPRP